MPKWCHHGSHEKTEGVIRYSLYILCTHMGLYVGFSLMALLVLHVNFCALTFKQIKREDIQSQFAIRFTCENACAPSFCRSGNLEDHCKQINVVCNGLLHVDPLILHQSSIFGTILNAIRKSVKTSLQETYVSGPVSGVAGNAPAKHSKRHWIHAAALRLLCKQNNGGRMRYWDGLSWLRSSISDWVCLNSDCVVCMKWFSAKLCEIVANILKLLCTNFHMNN